MDRKQGLLGGLLGQRTKEGGEGGQDAPEKGDSAEVGHPQPPGRVEAYEEDWYRSLKALAERRAQLAPEEEEQEEEQEGEESHREPEALGGAPVEPTPPTEPEETPQEELAAVEALVAEAPAEELTAQEPVQAEPPVEPPRAEEPAPRQEAPAAAAQPEELQAQDPVQEEPPVEPPRAEEPAPEVEQEEPALAEEESSAEPAEEPSSELVALDVVVEEPTTGGSVPDFEVQEAPSLQTEPPEPPTAGGDWTDPGVANVVPGQELVPQPESEPDAEAAPEPQPEPPPGPMPETSLQPAVETPSLSSRNPALRGRALEQLVERELGDGELEQISALILDPDQDVRKLALQAMAKRPDRVEDATIRQALQDPADGVRAVAVSLAAQRGVRDVHLLAPLVGARRWPLTQSAVLDVLPAIIATASPLGDADLDAILASIGEMESPPLDTERGQIADLGRALGVSRLVASLSLPDRRRLGAVRILVEGEEGSEILRALATLATDPIDEIREVAEVAVDAVATAERAGAAQPEAQGVPLAAAEVERIASLARSLQDADQAVRHLARSGLGGVDRGRVLVWAKEALHAGDVDTASAAAEAVGALRLFEVAIDTLNRTIELPPESRDPFLKALACLRLEDLLGLLSLVDESRKPEAVRVLSRAGGVQMLPHLRAYLDDPAMSVRMAVLEVMGESRDPTGAEVAMFVLDTDQSPALRAAAVRVIARTNVDPTSALARALTDPDASVRVTAIEELTHGLGPEADAFLIRALTDVDEHVRRMAMTQLASRGDNDGEMVWDAFGRCTSEERAEIGLVFSQTNPAALADLALQHFTSSDPNERQLAMELAGWSQSQACVEAAIQSLQDPVPAVRARAAEGLGRLRDSSAVRALGYALGDPFPDVRIHAVRALGVIDDEAVLGFLVAALQDSDAGVRNVASEVLTQWSSPAVAKRLAGVLAVPNLREAATELLKKIGPSSQELLVDVLLHGSAEVRPTVGALLAEIVGLPALVRRLSATEADVRLRAVEAVGAIGGPEAVEPLTGVLSDPDERIRVRATNLLAQIGDPRAVPAITESVLHDPVPDVMVAAQDALARLNGTPGDQVV
jgi:HEAT repeat protein